MVKPDQRAVFSVYTQQLNKKVDQRYELSSQRP